MIITISKQEIFNEVEKRSSLEGTMIPERFENAWASKEEGQFLDSFWIEGYTAVVQLMKRYLASETVTYKIDAYDKDEVLIIEAEMPKRYSSLLDGSVTTVIKMLIACNILHGWLEIKYPEAAAKYDDEAKGYSEDLRVKLLYRVAPNGQVLSASETDSDEFEKDEEGLFKPLSDDVKLNEGGEEGLFKPLSDDVKLNEGGGEGSDECLVCKDMCGETNINPKWEYITKARHDNVVLNQRWGECSCEGECNPCRCR